MRSYRLIERHSPVTVGHRMVRHVLLALAAVVAHPATAPAGAPPNIVLVFVDDLGYGDLGCYGQARWATPNLDRMASEGVRLTDFYVAQPVCSASRAALLTGCYPNRIGIAGALGPRSKIGLHEDETTLAEVCRSRGYATAIYGKWHLGHQPPFLPTRHGFDEFYGIPYSNDMWPLHPDYAKFPEGTARRKKGYPELPVYEGETIVDAEVTPEDQQRFTHDFTERAVAFIETHRDEPFFVYLAHPMPHVPLYVSGGFDAASGAGVYGDVVAEIDWSVGRILETLKRLGLDDRTLVIFASDNGPWLSYGDHAGTTGPLREGKGTTFEGGVRVPFIARWPDRIPAGTVCTTPVMTIDILPTIANWIGADPPRRRIDGRDVGPILLGEPAASSPHRAYFFYYHRNDLEAVRSGRWKLHLSHGYRTMQGRRLGSGGSPGSYDHAVKTGIELYDLETDVGETTDVADDHPEVVLRLLELVETMRADLGDNLTKRESSGHRPHGTTGPRGF